MAPRFNLGFLKKPTLKMIFCRFLSKICLITQCVRNQMFGVHKASFCLNNQSINAALVHICISSKLNSCMHRHCMEEMNWIKYWQWMIEPLLPCTMRWWMKTLEGFHFRCEKPRRSIHYQGGLLNVQDFGIKNPPTLVSPSVTFRYEIENCQKIIF